MLNENIGNTLIVGDLHAPFILEGYLEFCKEIYKKHKCKDVVFTGDIIDNHYSSYYESDPDGMSAIDELEKAKLQVRKWYKVFPEARVTIGNHDRIISRKTFSSGISQTWIKSISEVLETPGWIFAESFLLNDILFVHGEGRSAKTRATSDLISVVQGHFHTEGYINYFVGLRYKIFALQVGCGINFKKYAFTYGKHFKKPHICAAVLIDGGRLPLLEYMKLR
jgi:hypothetical protein